MWQRAPIVHLQSLTSKTWNLLEKKRERERKAKTEKNETTNFSIPSVDAFRYVCNCAMRCKMRVASLLNLIHIYYYQLVFKTWLECNFSVEWISCEAFQAIKKKSDTSMRTRSRNVIVMKKASACCDDLVKIRQWTPFTCLLYLCHFGPLVTFERFLIWLLQQRLLNESYARTVSLSIRNTHTNYNKKFLFRNLNLFKINWLILIGH